MGSGQAFFQGQGFGGVVQGLAVDDETVAVALVGILVGVSRFLDI